MVSHLRSRENVGRSKTRNSTKAFSFSPANWSLLLLIIGGVIMVVMFTAVSSPQQISSSDLWSAASIPIATGATATTATTATSQPPPPPPLDSSSFALARTESDGFFTDISDTAWRQKKSIYELVQKQTVRYGQLPRLSRYPTHFYTEAYEPEFTCPHEVRVGRGDGGKWLCDPHRIRQAVEHDTANCLVYSIGVKGDVQFEAGVHQHVSEKCEIHSFDVNGKTPRGRPVKDVVAGAGGTFHAWGITGNRTQIPKSLQHVPFKTLKETLVDLGHTHRTLDIFKIDVEGMEWEAIHDWLRDMDELGVTARQLLLEVHEPPAFPGAPKFFQALSQAGYVIFHKEANALSGGKCYEYAWVKLNPSFQQQ